MHKCVIQNNLKSEFKFLRFLHAEMDDIDEFNQYVEEVNKLRAQLLEMDENGDNSPQEAVSSLAEKQVSSLESINAFLSKFSANSTIEERLEYKNDVIVMPERNSVSNFVHFTKAAFKIVDEITLDHKNKDSVPDRVFFEHREGDLNRILNANVRNKEFNRSLRGVVKHFGNNDTTNPKPEDVSEFTINTILSDPEPISCSSPL